MKLDLFDVFGDGTLVCRKCAQEHDKYATFGDERQCEEKIDNHYHYAGYGRCTNHSDGCMNDN